MGDSGNQNIGSGKPFFNKLHLSDNIILPDDALVNNVEVKVIESKINRGGGVPISRGISFYKS